jgi:hypothetical protein
MMDAESHFCKIYLHLFLQKHTNEYINVTRYVCEPAYFICKATSWIPMAFGSEIYIKSWVT